MGKLTDSLLSGSSGRIGRLVVANVAGTEILRIRPRRRTTTSTNAQLLVQNRMKKAYQFIVPYKAYSSQYFGVPLGMRSRYNQAITVLLNACKIDFDAVTLSWAYHEVEFSRGNLLGVVPMGVSAVDPLTIKVDWLNNTGVIMDRETDELQLLLFAEDDAMPMFLESVSTRVQGTWTQVLPPLYQGKTVHAWIAFRSADSKEVSNSSYLGSVSIL